ncbi:hypothetical protein ADUPG1_012619, partial [Aduncisulcus paluster]
LGSTSKERVSMAEVVSNPLFKTPVIRERSRPSQPTISPSLPSLSKYSEGRSGYYTEADVGRSHERSTRHSQERTLHVHNPPPESLPQHPPPLPPSMSYERVTSMSYDRTESSRTRDGTASRSHDDDGESYTNDSVEAVDQRTTLSMSHSMSQPKVHLQVPTGPLIVKKWMQRRNKFHSVFLHLISASNPCVIGWSKSPSSTPDPTKCIIVRGIADTSADIRIRKSLLPSELGNILVIAGVQESGENVVAVTVVAPSQQDHQIWGDWLQANIE